MKRVIALTLLLASGLSSTAFAFTLAGTPTYFPEPALQHCATANNLFVCLDNFARFNPEKVIPPQKNTN